MKNTLNVGRISEGFVLDHIEAGKSMDIYKYLHLDKLDCCVAIIKNARSSKMGKKDIMKIECPIDFMGTWKLQQMKQNEEWIGVSKNPSLQITLTIRPDGSYSTNGYLGNVSGTWHLSKRNLTFYVGEQEYIKCYVTELWWEYCELQFTLNNETIYTKFKCNKK